MGTILVVLRPICSQYEPVHRSIYERIVVFCKASVFCVVLIATKFALTFHGSGECQ